MRPVLTLGRRAIHFAVLILAAYALATIPIGRHTGLQHLHAILRTKAARHAERELRDAAQRLGRRLIEDGDPAVPRAKPEVPALPHHVPGNAAVTLGAFEGADASVIGP